MPHRLDVIIYGASGYTGKRVVKTLSKLIEKENLQLKWGIAGRNREKLEKIKSEGVPVIIADSENEPSLKIMASKTRIIINCAGPYKYHGEPLVRACIAENCHYVDVAAEPQFQERIQLIYNEKAAEKKVYVVPSCGLDSLIADIGVNFLQKKFHGTINSVEMYLEIVPKDGKLSTGSVANVTTWKSLLLILSDYPELKKIRNQLFKPKPPKLEPQLFLKRVPHKVPTSGNLAVPYPGPDRTVIRRSQRFFFEKTKARPVQIQTYLATSVKWHIILAYVSYLFLVFLSKFKFCVNFLEKHPKLCTLGLLGDNPKVEKTQNLNMITTFFGRGWRKKTVGATYYKQCEDSWITVKAEGRDAYEVTAICVITSALLLLDEKQKLPEMGGVYTPANVFHETNIVEMLRENGVKFEEVGQGDI